MLSKKPYDLGIIGGGQLARYLLKQAARLNLQTIILDRSRHSPAAPFAQHALEGDPMDPTALDRVAKLAEVTTYDLEATNTDHLIQLKEDGHRMFPDPRCLALIRDKLVQRTFLSEHGFPGPDFVALESPSWEQIQDHGFPCVQKLRTGGYDGRGVAVLNSDLDAPKLLDGPSLIETKVNLVKEISVLVARNKQGSVVCYDPIEMMFDPNLNLIDGLIYPARIHPSLMEDAKTLALEVVNALNSPGVFAVEMFLTPELELMVNEIAPRTHNSGHVTMEASATCQFEQQLRAVLGLPLGKAQLTCPAAMVNLLGPEGISGEYEVKGIQEALAGPNVNVHLYGKYRTEPGRKLGHVTVLADDPLLALEQAKMARTKIRFERRKTA